MVFNGFESYINKRTAMSAHVINTYGRSSHIDPQKHVCVIQTTKGRVLAVGTNHSIANKCLPSIHAEPHAMAKAITKLTAERGRGFRAQKVDIVVARTNMGNSRPCSECSHAIFTNPHFNIRNVIYSDPQSTNTSNTPGFTSIKASSLFANRYQHITKHNLRQSGFVDPITGALYNPYNPQQNNTGFVNDAASIPNDINTHDCNTVVDDCCCCNIAQNSNVSINGNGNNGVDNGLDDDDESSEDDESAKENPTL